MLIQFEKSTRGAYGATSDSSRLDMREGASRNPAIQLPGCSSPSGAVAVSRVEETRPHPSFLSHCCSALIDIAAVVAGVLLICATGIGIAFAAFVLMFCSLK